MCTTMGDGPNWRSLPEPSRFVGSDPSPPCAPGGNACPRRIGRDRCPVGSSRRPSCFSERKYRDRRRSRWLVCSNGEKAWLIKDIVMLASTGRRRAIMNPGRNRGATRPRGRDVDGARVQGACHQSKGNGSFPRPLHPGRCQGRQPRCRGDGLRPAHRSALLLAISDPVVIELREWCASPKTSAPCASTSRRSPSFSSAHRIRRFDAAPCGMHCASRRSRLNGGESPRRLINVSSTLVAKKAYRLPGLPVAKYWKRTHLFARRH